MAAQDRYRGALNGACMFDRRFGYMRFVLVFCLALACTRAFASDQCDRRAELGGALAAVKYTTIEALQKEPVTGPTSEVWRILAFMSAEDYRKLGDTDEQIARTAQLIERTNVAADWQIEILVFSEFFRALCEANVDVTAIRAPDAGALRACFGDTPPGRSDFAACIRTEVRALGGTR